jgi:hypothetical protein
MRTRSELEALAERHGWEPRVLTEADIKAISSAELEYHSIFNSAELERALKEPAEREKNKSAARYWNAKNVWTGNVPLEKMSEKYFTDQQRWCEEHPQVLWNYQPNLKAFAEALRDGNLEPTYANIESVFVDLAQAGKLRLSLRALGKSAIHPGRDRHILTELMRAEKIKNNRVREKELAKEATDQAIAELPDEITSLATLSPEQVRAVLSPVTAAQTFSTQSAEEFRAEHLEAFTRPAGYFETKSIEQVILSVAKKHPEIEWDSNTKGALLKYFEHYSAPRSIQAVEAAIAALKDEGKITLKPDAQIQGQVTRYTDLGGDAPRYFETPIPVKTDALTYTELKSFQQKKQELTSDGVMGECKKNPRFRMWLDGELT